MKLNNKIRVAAVGVVSIALIAGAAAAGVAAAPQANGSDAPLHIYDGNGVLAAPAAVFAWDADILGSASPTDVNGLIQCPVGTTGVYHFLATPGTERTPSTWKANSPGGFFDATLKNVQIAVLSPISLINGAQAAAKAAGGAYSLGLACTTNNGVTVVGAFYRSISVVPVTGAVTFTPVDAAVVVPPVGPPAPTSTSGNIALNPTTISATNGVLALTVPAGAAATFNAPSLVNNKSTTTGTLGKVTVNDGRVVTAQGWTLSADVVNFVNSTDAANTISKAQLGFAPKTVAPGTTSTGVAAGSAQVAGSAVYPAAFASGAAANTVGDSVLDADLTFVAPQNKAAGTYNSTMTVTVTSK